MKEQLATFTAQEHTTSFSLEGVCMEIENEEPSLIPIQGRTSHVMTTSGSGIAIPSLEDLQRLQGTDPALLTARGGSTSARKTAVAEHIAMLSKNSSPRDDEADAAAAAAGGNPAGTAGAAQPGGPTPSATVGDIPGEAIKLQEQQHQLMALTIPQDPEGRNPSNIF